MHRDDLDELDDCFNVGSNMDTVQSKFSPQTTYALQILPQDLFTCVDIDELPRSGSPGSRVDEIQDPVGTLTTRSLRQVNASTSGARDSHVSQNKTVPREPDMSVVSNPSEFTVRLTQDGSQMW